MEETNSPLAMRLQLGRACQAFVFVAGDLAISPESAQHQRAKARGRERRVVKAAWISGSMAKVSLSREDGVGMGSLGLPITNGLGKGNKEKSGGKVFQGICWLCGEVGRRSGGVEAVEEEEEEVAADFGGVWTIASVEKGRTKAKGWRRPTKRRRLCEGGARRWRLCIRTSVACWRWTVEIWP